jgi:hypothetical protein
VNTLLLRNARERIEKAESRVIKIREIRSNPCHPCGLLPCERNAARFIPHFVNAARFIPHFVNAARFIPRFVNDPELQLFDFEHPS